MLICRYRLSIQIVCKFGAAIGVVVRIYVAGCPLYAGGSSVVVICVYILVVLLEICVVDLIYNIDLFLPEQEIRRNCRSSDNYNGSY